MYGQREVRGRRLAVAQERERWLKEQEELLRSEITTLEDRKLIVGERLQHAQQEAQRRKDAIATVEFSLNQHGDVGENELDPRAALAARMRAMQASQAKLVADRAAWEAQSAQLNELADSLIGRRDSLLGEVSTAEVSKRDAEDRVLSAERRLQTARGELEKHEAGRVAARLQVDEKREQRERLERKPPRSIFTIYQSLS